MCLPFGDRILFLVRLPLTILGRRIGRGVFRRPRYLANTPNKTTPAESDANTIYLKREEATNKFTQFKHSRLDFYRAKQRIKINFLFYLLCCCCVRYNIVAYFTQHRRDWLVKTLH